MNSLYNFMPCTYLYLKWNLHVTDKEHPKTFTYENGIAFLTIPFSTSLPTDKHPPYFFCTRCIKRSSAIVLWFCCRSRTLPKEHESYSSLVDSLQVEIFLKLHGDGYIQNIFRRLKWNGIDYDLRVNCHIVPHF